MNTINFLNTNSAAAGTKSLKQNTGANFTGLKIPSINASGISAKILGNLKTDVFQKASKVQLPDSEVLSKIGVSDKVFKQAATDVTKALNDIYKTERTIAITNGGISKSIDAYSSNTRRIPADIERIARSPYDNTTIVMGRRSYGTTTPLSFGDWLNLIKYPGMKSMFSINPEGKYSGLIKTGSIPSDAEIEKAKGRFVLGYMDLLDNKKNSAEKNIADSFNWGANSDRLFLVKMQGSPVDWYHKVINEVDYSGESASFVNEFWNKYGEELGVKHVTNLFGS